MSANGTKRTSAGAAHMSAFGCKADMPFNASRGVAIEGRNDWERGGRSIYFRDPDGHLLELATPGLWSIY